MESSAELEARVIRQERIWCMSALEEDDKRDQQSPPLNPPLVDEQTDPLEIDDKEKDHPEEREPLEEEEKKEQTRVVSKEAMLRVIGGQP
jgi:hypothetical protein